MGNREDLPEPWPDVLDALSSITNANQEIFDLVEKLRARHEAEMDELRVQVRDLLLDFEAHVTAQRHFNRRSMGLAP